MSFRTSRSVARLAAPVLLTLLASVACSSRDGKESASAADGPAEIEGYVVHRDTRLDVPSFVRLQARRSSYRSATEIARAALPSVAKAFAVDDDARRGMWLSRLDDTGKGGIVARYEQHVGDVEVFRGAVSVLFSRDLEPIAASGFLAPSVRGSERAFELRAIDALAVGGRALGIDTFLPLTPKDGYERFTARDLLAPARVKRVLYPVHDGSGVELEPAYYVELLASRGRARFFVVSAVDGHVLLESSLVHHDAFTYRVWADPVTKLPMDGPQGNAVAPHPTGVPDRMKLEWQPSQLVTLESFPYSQKRPWLPPGATTTKGNNVIAYADHAPPDGFGDGDTAPVTTEERVFGHEYDMAAAPNAKPTSAQAAATQLFYVTNFLHDWFYDAGFDEKSGNHQEDNFGLGGKDGDPLIAEVQDFSGRNNANALVPPDGASPRIQMFVFSGPTNASLEVLSPSSIAGTKSVGIANGFGADVFELTGEVVLAADGGGADPADACEAIENDVAGKIVLVHRGTCSFAQKAVAAQEAGAIGVIIANVASSASPTIAPFMGGTQAGIRIPVLSLNLADGQALEGAPGAKVTMKRSVSSDLDGALDTTIVAHEWGHVLSNRLVGNGTGLTTNQAGGLGEGWGDFVALLLTVREDDPGNFTGTYANGAYATSGSGDDVYFGTRRLPYSIDFTKNALTLKHMQDGVPLPEGVRTSFGEDGSFNAEVHNTGEVWASMLWECYAALLRDGRYSFTEAQERMKRYLVTSLKMTPVDPTIIEARDALLAAALAEGEDGKHDFLLFWKAFARRGAGAGAVGPSKDSATNDGIRESFEAGNDLQVVEAKVTDDVISCDHDGVLDEGEVGTIEVTVRNTGSGVLTGSKIEVATTTPGASLLEAAATSLPALEPFEAAKAKIRARVKGTKPTEAIDLDVAVTDPSLPDARVVRVTVPARYEADLAPKASAIDRVDTPKTAWKVAGRGDGERWTRSSTAGDAYWFVKDPRFVADHTLTSPPFTIEGTTFGLSFKHKWSFKRSTRRNADLDGGVVEVSVDDGKTWKDISEYGDIDYNTTLYDGDRIDNPLKGRKAFGGKSKGYPDAWITTKVDVTLPEHPESVRIRFRMGALSTFTGADGWAIDEIELTGTTSTPFWSFVPHADACDPNGPTTDAGLPQRVPPRAQVKLAGSATHPEDEPLTYLWSQVAGPEVALKDEGTLTPSFEAPDVTEPVTLTFALRAHDGALLSPASRVDVVVEPTAPASPAADAGGCGCKMAPSRSRGSLAALFGLAALVARRARRRS